jgi:uncharacterized membrane protein
MNFTDKKILIPFAVLVVSFYVIKKYMETYDPQNKNETTISLMASALLSAFSFIALTYYKQDFDILQGNFPLKN